MFKRILPVALSWLVIAFAPPATAELRQFDCLIEPQMTIELGSPAQGIVEEIPVRRGDTVRHGEVVARLQSDLEETALEMARTRLEHLEKQYNRLTVVQNKALASDEIVEQAKSEMDTARLETKRRKILVDQRTITSPVDAVVVERLLAPGEYVYEQTPLLRLAKTDQLNVEVLMPTSVYGRVQEGMIANVVPEPPLEGKYEATVEVIDKIMDAASSSFGVQLLLENPELKIPAGLRCTLEIDI